MKKMEWALGAALVGALLLGLSPPAFAKRARCFSTDDGYYACNFKSLGSDGSFETSASGYPTYTLQVDSPGFAYGFLNMGDRNVSLPGEYVRQSDDPACWANPETDTKICAW